MYWVFRIEFDWSHIQYTELKFLKGVQNLFLGISNEEHYGTDRPIGIKINVNR